MMAVFGFLNCEVILFAYDRESWKQRGAKTHFLGVKLTFRNKRIKREKKWHEKNEVLPTAPHCPSTGIINSTAMHKSASGHRFLGVEPDDSKIEDQRL